MSSIDIFSSGTNLLITLVALAVLAFSVCFSGQGIKIGKGIRYLFIGLVLEFVGGWFGYKMSDYVQLGISINILAFLELFILLLSMMFLALSASQLLVSNIPDTPIIGAITALGLVSILYFCLIAQDGVMVSYMRQIFLVSKRTQKQNRFFAWRPFNRRRNGYADLSAFRYCN